MVIPILLFIVGFVCLIKGGDWFVDGATGVAHRFHMPEILVGATVVAIGTTIPEVMVSATGAITGGDGGSAVAYGNAIGSIICNTSLIAAITMAVRPAAVEKKSLRLPILFFFGSAAFYMVAAYVFGRFYRWVGICLLAVFAVYIFISVKQAKNAPAQESESEEEVEPGWKLALLLVGGAAVIAVGAKLLVSNTEIIATALGVPSTVISLTLVALGTSLPELITAITALAKGHSDLSLGNVIGANLFNIVLVSGVASAIAPFDVPNQNPIAGMNSSLIIEIPLMIIVMLIMCIPAMRKGKVYRWQGILLLCIYVGFLAFQFFVSSAIK